MVGNNYGSCDRGELNTLNVAHTDVETLGGAAAAEEDSESSESDPKKRGKKRTRSATAA